MRLIYFTSGATMAQAMVGGDLEVADSDVPAMLNAVSAGAFDGKLISVYINRFPFAFVVRNDIKTPEDLKGKQIAISRFGSSSDVTTRMLLRQYNLDPEKDVRIIQATGTTRVPAMIAGQIHGTLLGTYDVPTITDSGCCRVMVDMLELPIDYARFGQVVPTQLLQTKRELLLKFAEGLIEGIYVFKTNKELALSVLRSGRRQRPGIQLSESRRRHARTSHPRSQRRPSGHGFGQDVEIKSDACKRCDGR